MNTYTKSTKRFTYTANRDDVSKQAGCNSVTITTNTFEDGQYSIPTASLTLTVKEALALQSFLNETL